MSNQWDRFRRFIAEGYPQTLPPSSLPSVHVDHAPPRRQILSPQEKRLAIENALRYIPSHHHGVLAEEFLNELNTFGRIIMRRFRPTEYEMKAHPIEAYPAKNIHAACIMLMIQNNLNPDVAQFPEELITYGGNGSVFQNWVQYRLVMKYLSEMTEYQTLVMYSGHPLGLFPSTPQSPRVIITNGMVIPNYSSQHEYERMNALGVTQYGQMTAGSYMYIGPQGIVHGTTITLMNAARLHLGLSPEQDLRGITFISSGLGGMSGAQAKAATICGAASIVAEMNPHAAQKRHQQGWVDVLSSDADEAINLMIQAAQDRQPRSIGYIGNVVDIWERCVERNLKIDLGSDQTSLHNPYQGGYYPAGYDYEEGARLLSENPTLFKEHVKSTLIRHTNAINKLAKNGMYFWDYGNAFLLEASRVGAEVCHEDGRFVYPSYVQDIMGPLCFDYGFGPYRWVCTSGLDSDLRETDRIAEAVLTELLENAPVTIQQQLNDNIRWIQQAQHHNLVVGSKARILYADDEGRRAIAQAMNQAISDGRITAPIVLGRDHHDVSGTDSPFRETANIYDGSAFTADMAVQNVIGDAARGASWVSLHNGGGVGWGEVMNGGFGLVLDGTTESEKRLHTMLHWDVNNGIARRSWARNSGAIETIQRAMGKNDDLKITLPTLVDSNLLDSLFG